MIAYRSEIEGSKVTIHDSTGGSITSNNIEDLLSFLLIPHEGHFRVVWGIDSFVAPILSLLDKHRLQVLFQTGRTWLHPYSITYNQGKSLRVVEGRWRQSYYYLSQYFPDEPEPDALEEIVRKGGQILDELDSIKVEPKRLTSPVALFDYLFDNLPLPNYNNLPDSVGQLSWDCSGKHWVEAHKLGWFEKAYDYDIIASFPSVTANLLDTRYGKWINKIEQPKGAVYGFAEGRVGINSNVSPIIYIDGAGHLYSSNGNWPTILAKQEIDFIEEFNLGRFTIRDAWWWVPEKTVLPLQWSIAELFASKNKSDLLGRILKRAMVGIYGRFLQTYSDGTFAPSFNPVWGSIIESEVRLKVARFILENKLEDNLLHVSTDGVLLNKKIPVENRGQMGNWRLDSEGEALVVSSGCLFYGDKRPAQITYPEAMALIKANPKAISWEKKIRRRMVLGDIMSGSCSRMGEIKEIDTEFKLLPRYDRDRDFGELPRDGEALLNNHYSSKPLKVSQLSKPKLIEAYQEEEL